MSLPSTEAFRIGYFFSAATAAFTKKDMKPSLTPCSFSNLSLYLLRRSMTGAMLTSLKVVRIALVDCDCSRRSAIRARRRLIGTRSSGRSPRLATGAATCGRAAFGACAASGAGAAGAVTPLLATAASASPLVTRPSRPVPVAFAAVMLLSARILAADGMAMSDLAPAAAAAGAAAGAGAAGAAAAGAVLTWPVLAPAEASVSMIAMVSPATTVLPSFLMIWTITPADGAGSSRTTLSVSMSIMFSSRATASPTFLCQDSRVASATDSDSWGTLTSICAILFVNSVMYSVRKPRAHGRGAGLGLSLRCRALLGQHEALELGERGVQQLLLLRHVLVRVADSRRSGSRTAGVGQALARLHAFEHVVLDLEPRALVLRLVLCPHHFAEVRVLLQLGGEGLVRERIQLLDTDDRGVRHAAGLAAVDQVVIHLARAGDHALDLVRIDLVVQFADHGLEAALGQVVQRRARVLVTQQRLRREDDQRLAELAHHLAAQQVEDLGGGGRLHHLHVVVGRQLQEALDTCRRVLRTLAFVTVRQHHHQAGGAAPLDFARGDELVDDDLRAVGEVAELAFPDGQGVRFGGRVAVFEAQHRFFRQHGVDDGEVGLVFRHVGQRQVDALVPALAVLVVQHGVAVHEGAAAGVLARQADRVAGGQQRGVGQVLAHAPVEVHLAAAHGGAVGQHFLDQRVQLEVFRHGRDALGQAFQLGQRDGGVGAVGPLLVQERRPVDGVLVLEVGQDRVDRVLAGVHRGAVSGHQSVAVIGANGAPPGQFLG